MTDPTEVERRWMRRALTLARRAQGMTSPNPMVGAVLVKGKLSLGEGYHQGAGQPHAEVEALNDCHRRGGNPQGATLFVTLEPCCTSGRTPPCTEAIVAAGIRKVVVGATDPNPRHAGRGLQILREAGLEVRTDVLADQAAALNPSFNHWIVHQTPLITLKAALTLDGKIATAAGESRWITGEVARRHVMRLRQAHDAILVGVNTVRVDDPALTFRLGSRISSRIRLVLDSQARTPLQSRLLNDEFRKSTLIVVGEGAPSHRLRRIQARAETLVAPEEKGRIELRWLCRELGRRGITGILVEGGGEIHGSFLTAGLAHRVAFFFAPKILGGRNSLRAIGGAGVSALNLAPRLSRVKWRQLGADLLLTGDLNWLEPRPEALGINFRSRG